MNSPWGNNLFTGDNFVSASCLIWADGESLYSMSSVRAESSPGIVLCAIQELQ